MTASSLSQTDSTLDEGGRLLRVIARPYPAKTAGIPISFVYDPDTEVFDFSFSNSPAGPRKSSNGSDDIVDSEGLRSRETEIFLPASLSRGRKLLITGLNPRDRFVYDESRQTLFLVHDDASPSHVHQLRVAFDPPIATPSQQSKSFIIMTLLVAILALVMRSYI